MTKLMKIKRRYNTFTNLKHVKINLKNKTCPDMSKLGNLYNRCNHQKVTPGVTLTRPNQA